MLKYTDIGKELMKSKVMAKFSHYIAGNLYYKVQLEAGLYQFPIATVEDDYISGDGEFEDEIKIIKFADDLGTTSFNNEMRGSELNRWIRKAIENDEFIRVG